MPYLFFSKYEKKYRLESVREKRIQGIQQQIGCSREYAVRYYDYEKHLITHKAIGAISAGLYFFSTKYILDKFSKDYSILTKKFVNLPICIGAGYLGWILYDKLVYHYLNWEDSDISHLWDIDYGKKYNIKFDENWENNIPLTPYERMKQGFTQNLEKINIEGEKVFKRLSKDRNNFYYLYGKVRNLENIAFMNEETLNNSHSSLELQMKVDSIKPSFRTHSNANDEVNSLQQELESYKKLIENSRNFRSIKNKFLGLPFMLTRHQQFPEPYRGTWQFDVYEQMFRQPYDLGKGSEENEEKINKYNYHLFLHPSVINKFDTNSEEFDMYLRQLNLQSNTVNEQRAKTREYFCTYVLPTLNLIDDKELGYDFANYLMNKDRNRHYQNYLYAQYSGQREEELFRHAEETKYLNKNEPLVHRIQYSTILENRIGIRSSELSEILENPTKYKKYRKALETKYRLEEPVKHIDKIRHDFKTMSGIQTLIDREIDPNSEDFNIEELEKLQFDEGPSPDENPDVAALQSRKAYKQKHPGPDMNTYPYGVNPLNTLDYDNSLDWSDYTQDKNSPNAISPKMRRFELFNKYGEDFLFRNYYRRWNNLESEELTGYVFPFLDYANEELKNRCLIKSNKARYLESLKKVRNSDNELIEFLENKTMDDSYDSTDDLTEEDLDQALFESTYSKPIIESEEFKSLKQRNHKEIEQLFKLYHFVPHYLWYENKRSQQNSKTYNFVDKAEMLDPLVTLYSEVEHPNKLKKIVKKWRSGAEMRFKVPYYPDIKEPTKTFDYI